MSTTLKLPNAQNIIARRRDFSLIDEKVQEDRAMRRGKIEQNLLE